MDTKIGTTSESQKMAIREILESGGTITPLEALYKLGCLRLGARIYDLRKEGMAIITETKRSGKKKYAEYRLDL